MSNRLRQIVAVTAAILLFSTVFSTSAMASESYQTDVANAPAAVDVLLLWPVGLIVLVAYIRAGRVSPEHRAMIRGGFRRSKNASWLPSADWETLLERPLAEVRKTLGVVPVESYSELRSEGAPAIA